MQVDLYYNGHKHIYYHTCPVRFGLCASTRDSNGAIQGTVYVTGGNAGMCRLIWLLPGYLRLLLLVNTLQALNSLLRMAAAASYCMLK